MSDEPIKGIATASHSGSGSIIGYVESLTVLNDRGESSTPLAILREHVCNLDRGQRSDFIELEKELSKSSPDKGQLTSILARLKMVLGGVGSCADAIKSIADAAGVIF